VLIFWPHTATGSTHYLPFGFGFAFGPLPNPG
jgi:hypothetical protein